MTGFLHLGGSRSADLNLIAQVAMAGTLTVAAICARKRRYRPHGIMAVSVVLLNLVMIGTIMLLSFPHHIWRKPPAVLAHPYYAVVLTHALLGSIAELLGLYVVVSAGTRLLPNRLRLKNYKPWMRTTFVLWWIALLAGGAVYYVWYIALPH